MSAKTICPECGEKIRRNRKGIAGDSYCCRAPDFIPRHWDCVSWSPSDEMAVTNGGHDGGEE